MAKVSADEIERVVKELGFQDAEDLKRKLQNDDLTLAQVLDRQFQWGRKVFVLIFGFVVLGFVGIIGFGIAITR